MRRAALVAAGAALWAASPAAGQPAAENRVEVRVVELAGGVAYLEPGSDAGLKEGTEIVFAPASPALPPRTFRVVAVTATSAVVELAEGQTLAIGERGTVKVTTGGQTAKRRAKPAPLETFEDAWPEPALPADSQNPEPIPIGAIRRGGATEIRASASAASWLPLGDTPGGHVTRATIRAELTAEPFSFAGRPLGLDADVVLGQWLGADRDLGDGSRPVVDVQELRARLGDRRAPLVGLGRLRHAALTVGLLDGVRVASPDLWEGIRVAGFGGVVPDTLDGRVSTDLARFGAEVSYEAREHEWRPGAELVVYGSMFDGSIDERRAAAVFRAYPGPLSVSGHAELSVFDRDNPWGARRLSLTAAGIYASVRLGSIDVAASFDAQQPERSRWLESLLPPGWLCTADPQPGIDAPPSEPCDGAANLRYYSLVWANARWGRLAVHAGGAMTHSSDGLEQSGGFADLQALRLFGDLSLSLGGMVTNSQLVDTAAIRAAAQMPILDGLDVDVFYRPAVLRYLASVDDIVEQRAGVGGYWSLGPDLTLRLSSEAMVGDDVTAVGIFGAVTWRAGF